MTDEAWLYTYISDSIRNNLCTTLGCTTCVAGEFRKGLLKAFALGAGTFQPSFLHRECAGGIAEALTRVQPLPNDSGAKFEEAVRCVLFDLWYALGTRADRELTPILTGSWSGEVLQSMKVHYENSQARNRLVAESKDPVLIEQRRAQKRALKQKQHNERLRQKKKRDRIWHAIAYLDSDDCR